MSVVPPLSRHGRRLTILLACLLFAAPCLAREDAGHELMLWKAGHPESEGTVYLLGTIHEAPPDIYPLDAAYDEAFREADLVVAELDAATIDDIPAARLRKLSTLPEGVTLPEVLGPELWRSLVARLEELGVPGLAPERIRRLLPVSAAFMLLAESLATVQAERDHGIESHFLRRARAAGTPIDELEGLLFQLELFADIPLEQQTAYLAMILDHDTTEIGAHYRDIAAAWKAGDLEAIAELVRLERAYDPVLEPFYAALLEGRNPHMAERIAGFLDDGGTTLVLVGAAHLPGELGILALLKERGVRLRRIESRGAPATRRTAWH
jgi:uncharacterized protein YbaP (TraB family)